MSQSKSFKLGRSATTGRFVPVKTARNNPSRYVVKHIPKAGRSDAGNDKKNR